MGAKLSDIDLDYDAITIDTCIFDNNGIALERGLLKQLDQFKESPVQVLISEVIDNEVLLHLTDKVKGSRAKINQALRSAENQLRVTGKAISEAKILIYDEGEDVDVARGRINDFYDKTGVEIITCEGAVEVSDLVDRYFNFKAPFENKADKKNEFPDALALLALESYAKSDNIKILAVSTDKGWAKFSENSDRIEVIDNLSDAISHFQPHNYAQSTIESIKSDYVAGRPNSILNAIAQGIRDSLDGIDIYVEANSSFAFEEDDVHAIYDSHDVHCDEKGKPEINIIRVESELVVIQITAYVKCEVHASFGLSVWDSIDKEYVGMGSASGSTEEEYDTKILISLTGDFSEGLDSVEVDEVEVIDAPSHVEFGEIEPDWWHEEP